LPLDREKQLTRLKKRLEGFGRVAFLAFAVLVGFSFYLQVIKGDYYYFLSEKNRIRVYPLFPPRGKIFDREGNVLATNYPTFDLYIVPYYLFKECRKEKIPYWKHPTFRLLVKEVGVDEERLKDNLEKGKRAPFVPRLIAKGLTESQLAKVESLKWALRGVYVDAAETRRYPYGELFAHVVGYVGEVTEKDVKSLKFYPGDSVGKTGLEKYYDELLHGIGGWESWEVDALGHRIKPVAKSIPTKGMDLKTTLLLPLQEKAKELFEGKIGAVVALDPNTGEVLALYSSPSFDPNLFPRGISVKDWKRLNRDKTRPMTNRAISGTYPPGSVFKLVVALAGLTEKKLNPWHKINCTGAMRFGNRVFRCWKRQGHGKTDLYKGIVQSCDVYFYNVGKDLGVDLISKYAFMLGLGKKTGIDLPYEAKGIVPTKKWKRKRFKAPWYPGETLNYAIGQGYINVTPIQLAVLSSFFANGGYLVVPHLNLEEKVKKIDLGIPKRYINLVRRAMLGVVEDEHGTAHWTARLKGIKIAGKTGTAQVVSREIEERYKKGHRIVKKRYAEHAWFVAFAPYKKPLIAVAVVVEHGGHGSSSAAPIAKEIIAEYLRYKGLLKEKDAGK